MASNATFALNSGENFLFPFIQHNYTFFGLTCCPKFGGHYNPAVPPYVWYVDRCTLWTDIKVIWITAMKVLKRADINNVAATLGSVGSYTDSRYTMFEVLRFIP